MIALSELERLEERKRLIAIVLEKLNAIASAYTDLHHAAAWLALHSADHVERNFWEEGVEAAARGLERERLTRAFTNPWIERYTVRDELLRKAIA